MRLCWTEEDVILWDEGKWDEDGCEFVAKAWVKKDSFKMSLSLP